MKTGLRRLLALALGAGLLTANTYAAATTFTDVPTTYWGYYYIDRAATEGLVSGIGDNQYGPEQTLSNAQFVTMISVYLFPTLRRVKNPSCSRSSRIDKSVVRLSWHSSARYAPEKANCPAFSSSPR